MRVGVKQTPWCYKEKAIKVKNGVKFNTQVRRFRLP